MDIPNVGAAMPIADPEHEDRALRVDTSPACELTLASYPDHVLPRVEALRALIIDTAAEAGVETLTETLKWGEPSYVAPRGSTLRLDWKPRAPDRLSLFFTCTSSLVPTFRILFADVLDLEGDRALHLALDAPLPRDALRACIRMALCYHDLKHLPLLGYEAETPTRTLGRDGVDRMRMADDFDAPLEDLEGEA